jgi:transposase
MNNKMKNQKTQENKRFQLIIIQFFTIMTCLFNAPNISAQNETEQQENQIIGEWFPLTTSRGGLGMAISLANDGTVNNVHGAYVAYEYRFKSDTLTFKFPNNQEIKNKVTVDKTKLIIQNKDANIELTRTSNNPNSGIIGTWKGKHYTGGEQIITYTASQNAYLSVPMTSENATYKIKGDMITFSGTSTESFKWAIDSNKLTLISMDTNTTFNYIKLN